MGKNSMNFLRDSLTHHRDLKNALDHKASFLLGISGIIFGLSVGHVYELQFLIIAISSFFTALLSVFVICLPFRYSKVKRKFGLMCWWGFLNKNFDQYRDDLNKVFISEEEIAHEYMKEIWNLANYSLKPKNKFLRLSSIILIFGLLGGFVLFFI